MKKYLALTAIAAVALTGCVTTDMRMGSPEAKTVATGAAGGASAENANTELERCDSSLGTISLVENQTAGWYTILTQQYRLPPTSQLLRLDDPAVQLLHRRGNAARPAWRHGA